ncbi:RNA polymerase sigma factor [Chitinophaga costaii]|nr:RNA polymerase sigma factor [Chitinophaga costaii]
MNGVLHNIDRTLLARIAMGDEIAFRALFYSELPWLTAFLNNLTRSVDDTHEIVQETFIRIWISRDKLPDLLEPRAWITRVATNECFTYFNKQARFRKTITLTEQYTFIASHGAEDRLQARETQRLIGEAVNNLPRQRKKIYQLSRENGLKIQEIADQLHCSPSYVKNALSSSLHFIRGYLIRAGKIIPLLLLILPIY